MRSLQGDRLLPSLPVVRGLHIPTVKTSSLLPRQQQFQEKVIKTVSTVLITLKFDDLYKPSKLIYGPTNLHNV